MRKVLAALLAAALAGTALRPAAALAQTAVTAAPSSESATPAQPKPPSAFTRPAVQEPAAREPRGMLDRAWTWILTQQQSYTRALATSIREFKSGNPLLAGLVLVGLSFTYGVLHAAGPGHGKAVISSYVLANNETVRRGILLSFLAALFQALSAIFFVGVLAVIMRVTSLDMKVAEARIETASWALVALIGAWLLYSRIAALWGAPAASVAAPDQTHAHGHACCGHDHHSHAHRHGDAHQRGHATHHAHDHAHDHTAQGHAHHHAGCSHAHMPAAHELQGAWSWRKAIALAFAVGIRPCTGAILVLVFAISQGLWWAGVLSTLAMALGTAIAVSVLAAMAVGSRRLATKLAGEESPWAGRIETSVGLAASAAVMLLGASFFIASLQTPAPL